MMSELQLICSIYKWILINNCRVTGYVVYRATWTTQRVATGVACGHLKVHCTLCRTNAGKRNGNKWPQMIIKHAKSKKKTPRKTNNAKTAARLCRSCCCFYSGCCCCNLLSWGRRPTNHQVEKHLPRHHSPPPYSPQREEERRSFFACTLLPSFWPQQKALVSNQDPRIRSRYSHHKQSYSKKIYDIRYLHTFLRMILRFRI